MADLSNIKHIVVLMLENRSFDNVFGFLRPYDADTFDGLDGNPAEMPGNDGIRPWTAKPDVDCGRMPNPDPGESYSDIRQQIFDGGDNATMSGFVANYVTKGGKPDDIMHCFPKNALPALSALAENYAVSDRWFASAPCQTWPNRFFVHTGTADGYDCNTLDGFPYLMQTIFNELQGIVPWKIYFHDFPQAALLARLWAHFDRFQPIDAFFKDAAAGALPGYAFIEPRYYPSPAALPNDMHPPHIVQLADALVARVYNAVRASPNWASTMMIVTFDEHGGCYDHVAPPQAVPPGPARPQRCTFDHFGVRVPAVVVSPYTQAGDALRAPGSTPFDHTSIIRTVRTCFGIASPLSPREAAAPDLSGALNAPFDFNHQPLSLDVPQPAITDADIRAAQTAELNDLQHALQKVAKCIAPLSGGMSVEQLLQNLTTSQAGAAQQAAPAAPNNAVAAGGEVRAIISGVLKQFAAPAGTPPVAAGTGAGAESVYRGQ